MGVKITGEDDLKKSLQNLAKRAEQAAKPETFDGFDVFTDEFMRENTKSNSLNTFLAELGVTDEASYEALPQEKLEEKVKSETSFDSWQDMFEHAAVEKKLSELF